MARRKVSNEPFSLTISALNSDGTGAAEHEGKTLRVHDALAGETVSARHLFGRKFKGQAETLEVALPSPDRTTPLCPSYGTCGACALQHMDYPAQLRFKQERLRGLLENHGVEPDEWLPASFADQWHYRRKARLSVRMVRGKGRVLVGFRERDGRFVTDMRDCKILTEAVAAQLGELSDLIGSMDASAQIPQIEVACGDSGCTLVFRNLEPLDEPDLQRLDQFAQQTGFDVWLQSKGPATARPLRDRPVVPLSYAIPDSNLVFEFLPLDFFQVNGPLNLAMIAQSLRLLDLQPGHRVLDLFCGLGNFTLPIARECSEIVGLEGSADLVARAQGNAARNGIDNAAFMEADLYDAEPDRIWPDGRFDRVLLDPPRSGAEGMLAPIARAQVPRIVYVSCNAETLARDAGILVSQHGYRLTAVGIMDMFPQTRHIETMALFELNDGD